MSFFSVRKVLEEAEAKLSPVLERGEAAGAKAKIERKRYGDGAHRFKFRVRNLALADATILTLIIVGAHAGEARVKDGGARIELESKDSNDVPTAKPGDAVELRVNDTAILSGEFYAD